MLSRVAESLYWMTRYLERAENTARLINGTSQVVLDLPRGASFSWNNLVSVVGLDELFHESYAQADENSVIRFLILDARNPSSILCCIQNARENTRTFREVLPAESWERINSLYLFLERNAARATQGRLARYEVLNEVIERRQSIIGLLMGSMSMDLAYQFIRLGRNLERADMSTRIIDVNSAVLLPREGSTEAEAERLWMATLNALSAYQMYRRHVSVRVRGRQVLDFVLKDPLFPRTVHCCLNELESCVKALPNHALPLQAVRDARQRLLDTHFDTIKLDVLHESLDQVEADLGAIHQAVSKQYFHLYQDQSLQSQAASQE
ncbi:MAG: alpha-E domain-containing protein [Thiobacillaceae bacterium]